MSFRNYGTALGLLVLTSLPMTSAAAETLTVADREAVIRTLNRGHDAESISPLTIRRLPGATALYEVVLRSGSVLYVSDRYVLSGDVYDSVTQVPITHETRERVARARIGVQYAKSGAISK